MRWLPGWIGRWPRSAIAVAAVLTVVAGSTVAGIGFNARYFDFLPEHTESAEALRKLA